MIDELEDGIYFSMPEDHYRAVRRLSYSLIKDMLVSPATFWNRSWMNENRKEKRDISFDTGKAYHEAFLDPEGFADRFCMEFDKSLYKDAVQTDDDVKQILKRLGLTQAHAGETALRRAFRLKDAGYPGEILSILRDRHDDYRRGRMSILAREWDSIIESVNRMKKDKQISQMFSGGESEVSILWTCPDTGVKMKARIDYLKPDMFVDLKTYSSKGKSLKNTICDAFRFNRYYIQAKLYHDAIEIIRSDDLLPIYGDDQQKDLIEKIRANPDPMKCWYVFQEKNGIPNLTAWDIKIYLDAPDEQEENTAVDTPMQLSFTMRRAAQEILSAKETFSTYADVYEKTEPWSPVNSVGTIGDSDFSAYWLDGGQ